MKEAGSVDKIICPRCSKGVRPIIEDVYWVPLKRVIVDYKDAKPVALITEYECYQCHHLYRITTRLVEER